MDQNPYQHPPPPVAGGGYSVGPSANTVRYPAPGCPPPLPPPPTPTPSNSYSNFHHQFDSTFPPPKYSDSNDPRYQYNADKYIRPNGTQPPFMGVGNPHMYRHCYGPTPHPHRTSYEPMNHRPATVPQSSHIISTNPNSGIPSQDLNIFNAAPRNPYQGTPYITNTEPTKYPRPTTVEESVIAVQRMLPNTVINVDSGTISKDPSKSPSDEDTHNPTHEEGTPQPKHANDGAPDELLTPKDGASAELLSSKVNESAVNSVPPFYKGQQFQGLNAFKMQVNAYAARTNTLLSYTTSTNQRGNQEYTPTYFRFTCKRGGKYKSTRTESSLSRPTRTSLKCDCAMKITGIHPMKDDRSGRNEDIVEICTCILEHTNGCLGGSDPDMNYAVMKRGGRKYPESILDHLETEVRAGRYSTNDVQGWLVECGLRDASLAEATNLRYRILKNLPIKGWTKKDADNKKSVGEMEDYLYNEDLAAEVTAGGKQSLENLQIVHDGLRGQIKGYDSRTTTDSENRFAGTTWMTGRMRARLRVHGIVIFLDDSRSGINTSGFCFWHVVVCTNTRSGQVGAGSMTMCASDAAVHWVLTSVISMAPFAKEVIEKTITDLGESHFNKHPSSLISPNIQAMRSHISPNIHRVLFHQTSKP